MNSFEAYSFLFFDSLFGNIVFYGIGELVLPVMSQLGTYNNIYMLAISTSGFASAVIINYLLGRVLLRLYKASVPVGKQKNYEVAKESFQRYGSFLLLLHILPILGWVMPLFAGFLVYGRWRAILFASTAKLIYYVYLVFL